MGLRRRYSADFPALHRQLIVALSRNVHRLKQMTFERTADYSLLNGLLRNPALYPFLKDDDAVPIEEASVVEHPDLWFVLVRDEGEPLGFYYLIPKSRIVFEFHTVMRLNLRALAAMWAFLGPSGWLWKNSECVRAVTFVPEYNRIALRFGLRAGLEVYGRNPKSFLRDGALQDQILLGIGKP
jgi:hypothetical protein